MTATEAMNEVQALLSQYGIAAPEPRPAASEAALDYSDAVISERLVGEALRGKWLWTAGMGWLRWGGVVWEPVDQAVVTEIVRSWMVTLVAGVASLGDQHALRTAAGLLSGSRIRRCVELAQGQVLADAGAFDADPDLLVCGNGVVDLRSGALLPHSPERLVTKHTPVAYRPEAVSKAWEAALRAVPEGVLPWLQVRFGQAATGHVPDDDRLCLLCGGGENGKSTVLGAVLTALGTYGGMVPDKVLLGSPGDHSTELMSLRGKRLAVIEETPEARHLSVARLKKVLGTEKIVAREVYKNNTEFKVTHALFVSSNYRPLVEETDHGTWRRLALVTFPYRWRKPGQPLLGADDRQGDPGLRPRLLSTEAQEAVLAWLVAGAMAWYAAGRVMPPLPERVEADTLAWRGESDSMLAYALDRLVADAGSHITTQDLTADLGGWLEGKGQKPWSDRTVGARFGAHEWATERGVRRTRPRSREGLSRPTRRVASLGTDSRYMAWSGVRFRTSEDALAEGVVRVVRVNPNFSERARVEKVSNDPDHPDHPPVATLLEGPAEAREAVDQ